VGWDAPDGLGGYLSAVAHAEQLGLDAGQQAILELRLTELSAVESIWITAKSGAILYDDFRGWMGAAIVTEMRPVFAEENVDKPMGVGVVHTLKIEYWEGAEAREFYVAMDGEDLAALQQVLVRASKKEEALLAFLASSGAHLLK
jgi:hypothetical protein